MNAIRKKIFCKKSLRGFTLLEMVISLGIFSIIALAVAGTFASGFSTYKETRALARNLENAQFAMNTLAKLLRTSTIVQPSSAQWSKQIIFYDKSSRRCFQYRVLTLAGPGLSTLEARWVPVSSPSSCQPGDPALLGLPYTPVTSGFVDGGFYVFPYNPSAASPNRSPGRVTIMLSVKANAGASPEARVQTSVSLRDYKEIGF